MEVKVIGQMDNTIDHTFESANRVYDKNGLAPTINTCGGGGLQPKVIDEVKELGFMDNGTGKHQSNTVVDENGLAPTVTTVNGGGTQQIKVLTENVIIGGEQEHQAIKKDGVCTTLTSSMGTGGGYVPMVVSEQSIVRMIGRNPENPSDRTVGAPTEQRLEPNSQGICNTLTSVTKDNLVLEKNIAALRMVRTEEGKALRKQYENHEITHGFNEHRVAEPREDGCSNTLSTVPKDNMLLESTNLKYRIRKLTPRECYRLMAVPEESIDKMLEVNSNTQCYKQAGNSIVVNCLIAIFSQMGIQGIPRWNEGLSEKYK